MEMTGLQIFKYLPGAKKTEKANCKECGCPTCMAYALKLAKQNIELSKCPYINDELKEKYLHSIKHPQKTIEIKGLKIGGENVLYRHEKTFLNRTTLAIIIDCTNPDYQHIIKRINEFEIKGVNELFHIDLIILKNFNNNKPLVSNVPFITFEEFENYKFIKIYDKDFNQTKTQLIEIRKKAILEKDEKNSDPVCDFMNKQDDTYSSCAKASYYICKYANMIVFENFDEAMFSTIVRLRENIYTDPQKPLQVESNLYEFNNPDKNSIVFLTTNFALTFFAVANELENLPVPSFLIVIPAEGMSVLTAWSAEKFTAQIVANTLKNLDIRNRLNTRTIIIPGLLSHTIEELTEAVPDFKFVVGTNEASAIKDFVKNLQL